MHDRENAAARGRLALSQHVDPTTLSVAARSLLRRTEVEVRLCRMRVSR